MTEGCKMSEAKRTVSLKQRDDHSRRSSIVHHFCSANQLKNKEALLPTSQKDKGEALRNHGGEHTLWKRACWCLATERWQ